MTTLARDRHEMFSATFAQRTRQPMSHREFETWDFEIREFET